MPKVIYGLGKIEVSKDTLHDLGMQPNQKITTKELELIKTHVKAGSIKDDIISKLIRESYNNNIG